ncbi:MAG: hypothetical protein BWY82_00324 [Verrucomicrobia bacterium ADurb.Bin474]|nr:MAG: hypothetical protein BWY82_00324 [Verrucomicrobia bacterium ADurb.Bin474]
MKCVGYPHWRGSPSDPVKLRRKGLYGINRSRKKNDPGSVYSRDRDRIFVRFQVGNNILLLGKHREHLPCRRLFLHELSPRENQTEGVFQ